jgi:methyl-accepting chemotaxis protein
MNAAFSKFGIRQGLQVKLVTWFLVLILVPMTVVGFLTVYNAKKIMRETLNSDSHTALNLVDQNISSFFYNMENILNGLNKSNVPRNLRTGNQADVLREFQSIVANDPQISNVYVGTADGKMLIAPAQDLPKDYDPRTRPWYKKAIENPDKIVWTDPYKDALTGDMMVSGARVLKQNGQVLGVLSLDIKISALAEMVSAAKIGETGYVFITTTSGVVIAHPDKKLLAQDLSKEAWVQKMLGEKSGFLEYTFEGKKKFLSYQTASATGWKIGACMMEEELTNDTNSLLYITLIIGLLSAIAAGAVGFWIARGIVQPIKEVNIALQKAEKGDLSSTVSHKGDDEIGELSQAFNNMLSNLRRLIRQIANNSEQVAASSEELHASADECAKAAEQVSYTVVGVAAGAEKQVTATSETTHSVQQMAAALQQVAVNAQSVSAISQKTAETAVSGAKDIINAVQQMQSISTTVNESSTVVKKLGQRSQEIGQIVDVISGIANQTNLLALNAAIEAARAGDQGRGFAVVAEEVRKLAEQSGKAAERIARLIREIQGETDRAVISMETGTKEVSVGADVVNRAGASFESIQKAIQNVVAQVQEITAVTSQMATNSGQIVKAIEHVEQIARESAGSTQTISAASEEQNASMEEVAAASQNLAKLAGDLQEAIQRFKI